MGSLFGPYTQALVGPRRRALQYVASICGFGTPSPLQGAPALRRSPRKKKWGNKGAVFSLQYHYLKGYPGGADADRTAGHFVSIFFVLEVVPAAARRVFLTESI